MIIAVVTESWLNDDNIIIQSSEFGFRMIAYIIILFGRVMEILKPVSCQELTASFDVVPQFLFPRANQQRSKKKNSKLLLILPIGG